MTSYPCNKYEQITPSYLLSVKYINISNDSPYFRCPDEERFYPFEILAFRTLKLYLFRVVVLAFNKFYFSRWLQNISRRSEAKLMID